MTCTDLLSGEAVRRHSVVQTDPAVGMAQNFSCSNYYTICNPTISPSQLELGFSQSGPLGGSEGWNLSHFGPNNSCTCGAWTSGSGSLYYLWASGNSSIASILSGGAAANSQWYGQYGGQTTASFSVTGPYGVACQVQAPAAVLPNVTIQVQSGFVSMAGNGLILLGGPGGISSTAITANGSPSGGTVVWNSGPRIQISGINSINASASGTGASSSGGDTYVGLTYTVNGQSRQASTPFTVLNLTLFNATSLGGSQYTTPYSYGNESGYLTTITYYSYDQMSPANVIAVPGIPFTEVLSTTSNPYGATFSPSDGVPRTATSNSSGAMTDQLSAVAVGGLPAGFSASRSQSITVNGFAFTPSQQQTYTYSYATISTQSLHR